MWYFTWVLGLGFAVLLAIVNALWLPWRYLKPLECRWAQKEEG